MELVHIDWAAGVEEPGSVTELEEASLSHSLLDDDIEDLAHRLRVLLGVHSKLCRVVDLELALLAHVLGVEQEGLLNPLGGPNIVS